MTAEERRRAIDQMLAGDRLADLLERRVAALEEIVAARWPRSVFARARLGRELRRSVKPFPGATFTSRRIEAVTTEWLSGR